MANKCQLQFELEDNNDELREPDEREEAVAEMPSAVPLPNDDEFPEIATTGSIGCRTQNNHDAEGFRPATHVTKRKVSEENAEIPTSNRFQALDGIKKRNTGKNQIADEGTVIEVQQSRPAFVNNTVTPAAKPKRVPPFYITDISDWNGLRKYVDNIIGEGKYSANFDGYTNTYRVTPGSEEDYRKLQAEFRQSGVKYSTNKLPAERPFKYIVRGIPTSISADTVKEDLESRGMTVLKASNLVGKEKVKLPLILLQMPKSESNKGLFNIRSICGLSVKIVRFKKKSGPSQCFNCQRYFHGADTCQNAPRCVKCAGDHCTRDCTKKNLGQAVKCVNCRGNHPASYRGCSMNPANYSTRKSNGRNSNANSKAGQTQQKTADQNTAKASQWQKASTTVTPTRSYSSVVKNGVHNSANQAEKNILLTTIANTLMQLIVQLNNN